MLLDLAPLPAAPPIRARCSSGKSRMACENTQQMVDGNPNPPPAGPQNGIHPGQCASPTRWAPSRVAARRLRSGSSTTCPTAITKTATVNFTNLGFLKQYAIVFAASAILTVLLWLLSVVKRAVRGDSIVTAIGEATGFLWMAVLASAFTPVILAGMVKITDQCLRCHRQRFHR